MVYMDQDPLEQDNVKAEAVMMILVENDNLRERELKLVYTGLMDGYSTWRVTTE